MADQTMKALFSFLFALQWFGSCKGNAKEVLVSPWQAEMLPTNAKPAIKANQEAALVK